LGVLFYDFDDFGGVILMILGGFMGNFGCFGGIFGGFGVFLVFFFVIFEMIWGDFWLF
jgi:hypothetical protein